VEVNIHTVVIWGAMYLTPMLHGITTQKNLYSWTYTYHSVLIYTSNMKTNQNK